MRKLVYILNMDITIDRTKPSIFEALDRELANTKTDCLRAEIIDLQIGYKL
jgi:hypothetical protein